MSGITRRRALGAVAVAGAAAGLAAAGPAIAGTARTEAPQDAAGHAGHGTADRAARGGTPPAFDEVYRGRRIQGGPTRPQSGHGTGHGGGHSGGHGGHDGHGAGYAVHIDGEELHVMENADGTWVSVINHYEPADTPREIARAAVLELQGAALVPLETS
ncbi:tyrosinase family oxidase copper chaperone [Streptomyces sp. 549]|uniref:apotyrosinase chaperone MelC1 n=1 Tax=Streptomyces sp. 549 TaxID=3049076 RepID=UPI0024C2E707|nr:tyrosinase family oxidase copper chaperone [Streptomyces sp. 549]MDK1476203.1 tyrosinase family oxidase copper chaperone [Streptomyces sp. 549]